MIKFTSNEEISKAIENYKAILKDPDALIKFFSNRYCFYYEKQHYLYPSANMHAYPAIHNDEPVFLLIPSHYDVADKADSIYEYVIGCPVTPEPLRGNRIPPAEAQLRIDLWKKDYTEWIPKQVASENGMFQAVQISSIDFETKDSELYMALRPDGEKEQPFAGDVVVMSEGKTTHYDDFATMIPPLPRTASATSFYLLSL